MRVAGLTKNDITNGEGICVSLWVQGCPHRCKGCHNPESWDFNGGEYKNNDILLEEIYEEIKNIDGTADAVIFDGVISQRLVDVASQKGIKKLVAFNSVNIVKKPNNIQLITID